MQHDHPACTSPRLRTQHAPFPSSRRESSGHAYVRSTFISLLLLLLLGSDLLSAGISSPAIAQAAAFTPFASAPGTLTLQRFLQQGNPSKAAHGAHGGVTPAALAKASTTSAKNKANAASTPPPPSAEPATMHPVTVALDGSFLASGTALPASPPGSQSSTTPTATPATKSAATALPTASPTPAATPAQPVTATPLVIKGSDGRLEVDVPRGALDFSKASRVGGGTPVAPLTLQITQLSGHSIGSNNLLGRYLIQVVDSAGKPVQGITVRQPLTIRYHYQAAELRELNLDPNGIFLSYPSLIPLATTGKPAPTGPLVVPFTNNAKTQTLTAQTSVLEPAASTTGGPSTFVPPPKPLLASVQGNSGQLTYDYPLSVAPGPGGFQPDLKMTYSSQATNGRHDPRSPADSTGDGWSIPMPSISQSWFGSNSAGDGAFYYTLSDVDHVSDRLAGADSSKPHVKFVTQHDSHLRIRLDNTNNSNGASACFHVWGLDGTYYEIGCTGDSSQCAIDSNGNCSEYLYNVNKIVAPYDDASHVRMMLITYDEDTTGSGSTQTVRDSVLRQIRYGLASSPNASSLSSTIGTVDFLYHGVKDDNENGIHWVTAYGNNYNCSSTPDYTTTLRCDDTREVNSQPAPAVMSTFTLDSAISYVGKDDSSSHKMAQYTFKYQDDPANESYQDPITHDTEGAAGHHFLTSITPTTFQDGTARKRKGINLKYTVLRDTYYDSWNPPNQSYSFQINTKWPYLTSYIDQDTGSGGNATYMSAENNTHGTPYVVNADGSVDDRHNPFYCTVHANDSSDATQCKGNYDHPDERAWSNQVVTQTQIVGTDSSASALTPATTTYTYQLGVVDSSHTSTGCNPISVSSPPGQADCVADTWVPKELGGSTDLAWKDYFHGDFVGFNVVYTTSPAKNLKADYYYTTEGWGTYASDAANYNSGQLYQSDIYQGSQMLDSALLTRSTNTLTGEGGNATSCNTGQEKLYSPCLEATISSRTTDYEGTGTSNANAPWVQTDSTYDDYSPTGGLNTSSTVYHELLTQTTSSSNAPTQTKKMSYQVNDQTKDSVTYYHMAPTHIELDDSSGHVWQCQDTVYDEGSSLPAPSGGFATSTTSYSNCADQAHTAMKSYTAYDAYGNVVATVDAFGTATSAAYQSNGCQLANAPVDLSTAWAAGRYTSCSTYDSNGVLKLSSSNVYNQSTATTYDNTQGNLPTSTTDVNNQKTTLSYSYDSQGDQTVQLLLPDGSGGYTEKSSAISSCTSSSTLPCYEVDSNLALYPNAVMRTFYDSQGRVVETRKPLDSSHDTITFTVNNDQTSSAFVSESFRVAASSSWIDPNTAKDDTGVVPVGTSTYKDALGRVMATQDPLIGSSSEPGISCAGLTGTWTSCLNYGLNSPNGSSTLYSYVATYDANNHLAVAFSDSLQQVRFSQNYSSSGSLTNDITTEQETRYNAIGNPIAVIITDLAPQTGQSITSVTTTAIYDDLGRISNLNDPDRGIHTYTYDADGRPITEVSGNHILGTSYDLLSRSLCVQDAAPTTDGSGACSSGSHPLIQNTYDQSKLGSAGSSDFPIGQLTQSIATTYYPDGTSASTTQQSQHDQRGRVATTTLQISLPAAWNVSTALPTYQETQAYNDADQQTSTQTTTGGQTGYTFTQVYDSATGQLTGLSTNTTGATNLATLGYDTHGQVNDLNFLATSGSSTVTLANDHFGFDGALRPATTIATWQSGSGATGTIFSSNRTYDAVGNVVSLATTHAAVTAASNSGGSETQNFCYDGQYRLVWAGNSGTQPAAGNGTCGSATLANTLGGNSYSASYIYTHLGQLWQGPTNGVGVQQQYLYCNSSQPHQVTALVAIDASCSGPGTASYSASYDAWGNMSTRTTNSITGHLSYDVQDHLVQWDGGSAGKDLFVYDATGARIMQRTQSAASTAMTVYAFGLEEHVYDGSGNHQSDTSYYSLGGRLIGELTTAGTQCFLTDALGSVLSTFNDVANSATVLGNQVYGPYGNQRYSAGAMGTNKGFTGQYADAFSGLDYYNARYYDPVIGRFVSADTIADNLHGIDPYAYVRGNPETFNDPTGHLDPYGEYVVAWYKGIHSNQPADTIKSSADGNSFVAAAQASPDIRNDTKNVIWEAKTGNVTLVSTSVDFFPGRTVTAWSTQFPGPKALLKGINQVNNLVRVGYQAGTTGNDIEVDNYFNGPGSEQRCLGGICNTFFLDGTVMQITLPSLYTSPKGRRTTPMSGVIGYHIMQVQISPNQQLTEISYERYQELYPERAGQITPRPPGPPLPPPSYTVQAGDTLSGIASSLGLSWQALYQMNQGTIGNNPNLIFSGEHLHY